MTSGAFHRWLYRGNRPRGMARAINRVYAWIASSGVLPQLLVTLEVVSRRSGGPVSLPLVVAVLDGQRYLVSMLGNEAAWVRNVRAAAGQAVLRSGGREAVTLEEVPVVERAPILKAYLQRAPGARPHIPVDKDAALTAFVQVAADFPALGRH